MRILGLGHELHIRRCIRTMRNYKGSRLLVNEIVEIFTGLGWLVWRIFITSCSRFHSDIQLRLELWVVHILFYSLGTGN